MDRALELELMDELIALKHSKSHFVREDTTSAPVERYFDPARFALERDTVLRHRPHAAALTSEMSEPGDFRRVELAGLPVLITRGKDGVARAFLNVCRHRGAQLVGENTGCRHRFTCPYHAWTYASSGELISAPHLESGFPDIEKSEIALTPLPTWEAMGFVWVVPNPNGVFDFESFFAPIVEEFGALDLPGHVIANEETLEIASNWKILIEGGIEAYHFKVTHRNTIGPFFEDNLSSYQCMGAHMRSVLPRVTMADLPFNEREEWRVRDHANVIYSLFPTAQFLVQQDHVVMIVSNPIAADKTMLRLVTLVPADQADRTEHWARNHEITLTTLKEDFDLGEGIQAGLASGANTELMFGRFESALADFNQTVDDTIRAAS